jgi:serine/threonine protein phosphatase PrpC
MGERIEFQMTSATSFDVEAATRPRIGRAADANEDAAIAKVWNVKGRYLALIGVADGLGTCVGSARASRLALETIADEVSVRLQEDPAECLRLAFAAAQRRILEFSPDGKAGTTATCALVSPGECVVANVGDSRAALISGEPCWCTTDHTALAKKLGRNPTRIEAKTLPGAKRLRYTLGDLAFKKAWVDVYSISTPDNFPGIIICTDGIWTECELPELIAACLAPDNSSPADTVISIALERDPSDDCGIAIALNRPAAAGMIGDTA